MEIIVKLEKCFENGASLEGRKWDTREYLRESITVPFTSCFTILD
jgi:hypothetical protein